MQSLPDDRLLPVASPAGRRCRVITDNDYSGDPDGLYQLAHLLLSPSIDLRVVIGSHLAPGDPQDPSERTADHAREEALKVMELLGRARSVPALAGSNVRLPDGKTPRDSAAARAIIEEAMRADTDLPLYLTLGGGLTELASAYMLEPRIADRLIAIWIGGPEYADLGAPPFSGRDPEYNLNIDLVATQVVFNDSPIRLWQVPRNAYRQCLVSMAELLVRVAPMGAIGAHLYEKIRAVVDVFARRGDNLGETFILGDNPLALLTALQSSFQADTTSSQFVSLRAPRITDEGAYAPGNSPRSIRVYTRLDVRLMLEDLFLKLQAAAHDPDHAPR
jgi:purine nucleosidase